MRALALACVSGLCVSPASAVIDTAVTDGVWKVKFGVSAAQWSDANWLLADSDGDGLSNGAEMGFGTNPFVSGSVVQVTTITVTSTQVSLTFPTLLGKSYVVQGSASLSGFGSLSPSVSGNGTGNPVTLTGNKGAFTFFRVLVQDLDTDGDGVSDWAELETGLNPALVQTVPGVNDHDAIATQFAVPYTINISAAAPFASEDGPTAGSFVVTRTNKVLPLTVNLNTSGTAFGGTDYTPLPGSVSFLAGEDSKTLNVTPIQDNVVEGSKSVTSSLVAPGASPTFQATLGTNPTATVIITDSAVPAGTGLLGRYYDTATTTQADAANFGQLGTYVFTRGTPTTTGSIVVTATPAHFAGLLVGHQVKLTFTSGNAAIDNATYDHQNFTVTAVGAGTFTVSITSASSFGGVTTTNGNCAFSIQSIPQPATLTRLDSTVNFDWQHGTPNGAVIAPNNSPDNYSDTFEMYLHPTTAGNYVFQLDADDKARVLLDQNGDGILQDPAEQILEHGWDGATTPETIGTFKVMSSPIVLAIPAGPAQRYKMRVEHVETTGDARCRLQWGINNGGFVTIPTANQFTHTQAPTYLFTRASATAGTATLTLNGHGLANGNSVTIAFAAGNLFTPNVSDPNGYSGTYTVTNATANTFDVAIVGTNLPANVTAATNCFLENRPTSTTTGVFNKCWSNITFTGTPGRIGVDSAVTAGNNGIWNTGTPDLALIAPDTFSVRWTGQVQPQFTEEYTFVVQADEGCALWFNGQAQVLRMAPSASTGNAIYTYDSASGSTMVNYASLPAVSGSFVVGESVRLDPTSGNLSHAPATSPTYSYDTGTGLAVIDYTNLTTVTPGGFIAGETIELDPTSGSLTTLTTLPYVITAVAGSTFTVSVGIGAFATGTGNITVADTRNAVITSVHATGTGAYTYTSATGSTLVTYTALGLPAGVFVDGQTIALDPTSGNLNNVVATQSSAFKTISNVTATTFTVSYPTGHGDVTNGSITIVAPSSGLVSPGITNAFTCNFGAGKYANNSTGNINVELVNKSLKHWSGNGNERFVRIPVVGGTRYDIQLDMYENAGPARSILSWYSPSQTKQVIPTERLYPSNTTPAPAAHAGITSATGLVGGPFFYTVGGTNGGTVSVTGLPAGLSLSGGVISGTPTAAGSYQILITITNSAGTSTSVLNLEVEAAGGTVPREFWNGVAGTTVASIPVNTTPTGTTDLTSLEGPTNTGDNYGARIRGYITAPETGNYYFWIAASNSAELWISDDDEPVNIFKRASVLTGSATPQTWGAEANQKSPWLALDQGRRYYFEVLHKAGVGSDNLAVGWLKPGQSGTVPSEIVPGYVLSPYVAPPPGSSSGTLYLGTMLSQSGAVTNGVGSSTLRLSEDENTASMRYSYSGLTGAITSQHIHTDAYLTHASTIVYDIDTPATPGDGLQSDGSHKWTITPVGTLSKADIVEIIKQGKAYINLHTAAYPNGEIRGNYTLANGTRTFTPPPAPPTWTDDSNTDAGAARFLTQATFGANIADIQALKAIPVGPWANRYEAWIEDQFTKPATQQLPEVLQREIADVFGPFDVRVAFNTWWKTSMTAPDQLRQRIAFALSEIHVVSGEGPLEDNSRGLADFYDTLAANAFGNFRNVLEDTTLTPAMGRYLDMLRNDKPDLTVGRIPNENYAREIKQLFSIGLYRMWPDGTLMLTSHETPIDTYTQREIVGLAHVFTGWDYGYDGTYRTALNAPADWTRPMREVPSRHFTGQKRVLNNEVLPGLSTLNGQTLDPYATHAATYFNEPAYQALAAQENEKVHDMLFNHPNTGPFICRQLIQRMVTSHPSRDYLYRVVQKFNDNGSGVRGDMKAVIKAILLDYEARSPDMYQDAAIQPGNKAKPSYGKQREPIMRVAQAARAFRPSGVSGTYAQTGTNLITVTTGAPHLLATGNVVFLEFTDATPVTAQPAPTTGSYPVTVTSATTYTIPAPGWQTGTYSQSGTTITVTMSGHWLPGTNASQSGLSSANFGQAYFDFTSGPANGVASFDQTVRTTTSSTSFDTPSGVGNISGTTFTLTAPYSATATNQTVMISRFPSSYSCTGAGGTITIDTTYSNAGAYGAMADHGLSIGDSVFLNFMNSRDTTSFNETSTTNDVVYSITGVPDPNTFTVQALSAPNAAMNSDNQVTVFPHKAQPMVRNGTVNTRQGTFNMDNTDTDLAQTPLNSPTVFNYFLPDYKFSGTLASQGLTTPEFQLTAETTAIRQSNFIYNGLFNPGNTNGISSFKTGSHALVLDLSRWLVAPPLPAIGVGLGAPANTAVPWTHNENLATLISQLNTLLLAGQLPATSAAIIKNFIATPISAIATGSPCLITTSAAHKLNVGDTIMLSGVTGGVFSPVNVFGTAPAARVVASTPSSTTFTLTSTNCTGAPSSVANAHVSVVQYNQNSASDTNKRDRLRSIIHLILTSPDYTIQR